MCHRCLSSSSSPRMTTLVSLMSVLAVQAQTCSMDGCTTPADRSFSRNRLRRGNYLVCSLSATAPEGGEVRLGHLHLEGLQPALPHAGHQLRHLTAQLLELLFHLRHRRVGLEFPFVRRFTRLLRKSWSFITAMVGFGPGFKETGNLSPIAIVTFRAHGGRTICNFINRFNLTFYYHISSFSLALLSSHLFLLKKHFHR